MLSLILPTFNEAENLPVLLPKITEALKTVPHEIVIVDDDSPDRTWEVADKLRTHFPRLRVIHRVGKRGLSSAVTDGFDAAQGSVLMVMDSDGQHDPALLRALYKAVQDGAGVAVGSRYMPGGSVGNWVRDRRILSRAGTYLANAVCRVNVSDPLGGFFAIDANLYRRIARTLRPTGFKILLEVLAAVPAGTPITEIPLVFQMRMKGNSKLSPKVHLEFIGQILRLGFRRFFPAFFIALMVSSSIALLPRAWDLRTLADASVRSANESALRTLSAERGWLLSDMHVFATNETSMTVRYHPHLRTHAPAQDCIFTFADSSLACQPS